MGVAGVIPNAVGDDGIQLQEQASECFQHVNEFGNALPSAQTSQIIEHVFDVCTENIDVIREFFTKHPEILESLLTIHAAIDKYFARGFVLDAIPPGEDATEAQLVIRIKTSLSAKEARRILTAFRQEWWYRNYQPWFKHVTLSFSFSG